MKLHLGCGSVNLPGFVNVDIADFPHIDHQQSVADLAIFADNSAELIYASHVLEHFDQFEVKTVLDEWKRVLAPGGILRLAVPDFEQLVAIYHSTQDVGKILGYLFGQEKPARKFTHHKCTYDFRSLQVTLETAGFVDVKKYDWRKTLHKDYPDCSQAFYNLDPKNRLFFSLNVECQKP